MAMPASAALHFVIIGGLGGEKEYEERFAEAVGKLSESAHSTVADESMVHVLQGPDARLDSIVKTFIGLQNSLTEDDSLAVYLIGHGTHDGDHYKFNIPGPDITAARLANLLEKIKATRQLVVNTTSSSGGSVDALLTKGRVVIAATKNGREKNVTMFGKYWADAFEDPEADIDKNQAITVQEAYDYTDAKVKLFFESASRLATEHARIEGELTSSFTLARLGEAVAAASDPAMAPLIARREAIEMKVDQLKLRKDAMSEGEYFGELQELLLKLADVHSEIEAEQAK